MSNSKAANCIDIAKLFFAYCVVAIHTQAFMQGDAVFVANYITGFAVPFFMVCSGFFLGAKISCCSSLETYRKILRQYCQRLLHPYFVWGILYFVLSIASDVVMDKQEVVSSLIYHVHYWLVSSPGGGLWYVQTLIILCCLLMLTNKSWYHKLLTCVLIAGNFVYLLMSEGRITSEWFAKLHEGYYSMFLTNCNALVSGAPFLLGFLLAKNWKQKKPLYMGIGAFTIWGIYVLINITNWYGKSILMSIIEMFFVVVLFCFLLSTKASYSHQFSIVMRKMSTIIYFTHFSAIYAVKVLFQLLDVNGNNRSMLLFFVTSLVLTLYSLIIIRMNKKQIMKAYF